MTATCPLCKNDLSEKDSEELQSMFKELKQEIKKLRIKVKALTK